MAPSSNRGDDHSLPPSSSTVILMLTIADTTWRLFIPSVGLTIVGLLLDKHWHTTPWLMIAGIVIGSTLAALLVWLQVKKVKK